MVKLFSPHVMTSVQEDSVFAETNEKVQNIIKNNTDLYNEINTAYDTTVEIMNKVSNDIEAVNNSIAEGTITQLNSVGEIVLENVDGLSLDIEQINKGVLQVQLVSSVQHLNDIKDSNVNKGIVADMLGLTSKSDVLNEGKQVADQSGTTKIDKEQETKQETYKYISESFVKRSMKYIKETFWGIDVGSPTVETGVNRSTTIDKKTLDSMSLSDTNVKDTNIQNYITSFMSKTDNINEYKNNLVNNITSAGKITQTNSFAGLKAKNVSNIKLNIKQSNDASADISNKFESFMDTVKQVLTDNQVDKTSDTKSDKTTATKTTSDQSSTQTAGSDISQTQKISQTALSNIIGAYAGLIIGIIVLILLGLYIYYKFFINKNTPNYKSTNSSRPLLNNSEI